MLVLFVSLDNDVGSDVDVGDDVDVDVSSSLRNTKEESTIQRNSTALIILANIKVIKYVIWCFLS